MSRRADRGSVTMMVAALAFFLFSMAFLVADGSRKLANIGRAQDVASEAARAAAATLDVDSLAAGAPRIDMSGERARAQAELVIAGGGPQVQLLEFVVNDSATAAFVRVRVTGASWVPGFDVSGTGSHTAQVIDPSFDR